MGACVCLDAREKLLTSNHMVPLENLRSRLLVEVALAV